MYVYLQELRLDTEAFQVWSVEKTVSLWEKIQECQVPFWDYRNNELIQLWIYVRVYTNNTK